MNAASNPSAIGLRDFRWAVLLVAISWLLGAWLLLILPARVPVHWNAQGEVDRYGSALEGALLPPAIATFLTLVFSFLPRLDPRRANYVSFRGAYVALCTGIVAFVLLVQGLLAAIQLGHPLALGRLLPVGVGLLIAAVGLVLPRLRPNWVAGIRTPWTLEDDRVWDATHRFGGKLFVVCGLAGGAVAAFLPAAWMVWVLVLPIVGAALAAAVYSYAVWRRLHGPGDR